MWQSKGSLCDRLGAYCRATWLLTLWQRKDRNLALTVWQALQPLCDNLKTDCATREVQTAEHTDFFFEVEDIRMNWKIYEWIGDQIFVKGKIYEWIGRHTNELGFIFFWEGRYTNELAHIRMNWGSDFWRGKIYEWIGRHTNELGLQADWPAAAACHCVTMHDKLRAHCVTT